MKKILLVDDDRSFLRLLTRYVRDNYPGLEVVSADDAVRGLAEITPDLDLLLLDLEMPGMDGAKLLAYACQKGLDKSRIIILSGHDADYLHDRIPMGKCLAVLNKHDARQREVLDMVFAALQKRYDEHTDDNRLREGL